MILLQVSDSSRSSSVVLDVGVLGTDSCRLSFRTYPRLWSSSLRLSLQQELGSKRLRADTEPCQDPWALVWWPGCWGPRGDSVVRSGQRGASSPEAAKGCGSFLGAPPPAGGGLHYEICPSRELSRAEERRPANPGGASFPSPRSLPFPFLSKISRDWLLRPEISSVSPAPSTEGLIDKCLQKWTELDSETPGIVDSVFLNVALSHPNIW